MLVNLERIEIMNNPFRHHTNNVFASRGCDIDSALSYANDVITAMPTEVQAHAMTALMVVVNTAANAFDQARGPSPEKLAILELIHKIVGERLVQASGEFEDMMDEKISNWMHDNLNDKVQDYMNDNIDIDNSISEWMNEYLESHVKDEINNLELIVKAR